MVFLHVCYFEDGTDLYWARVVFLEKLNQIQSQIPQG